MMPAGGEQFQNREKSQKTMKFEHISAKTVQFFEKMVAPGSRPHGCMNRNEDSLPVDLQWIPMS